MLSCAADVRVGAPGELPSGREKPPFGGFSLMRIA
jgi:hypothetical protein